MHYHSSKLLKLGNAALDFALILLCYLASCGLRILLPLGALFSTADLPRFLLLALAYALFCVALYAAEGSYNTIYTRGFVKEAVLIGVTNIVGFALVATFAYVFRLQQLSRLLLGYFYLLSTLAVLGKRLMLDRAAKVYVQRHDLATRVLLVGGGDLAVRFYESVLEKHVGALHLSGYLADTPAPDLPEEAYFGTFAEFHATLEQCPIDTVVIAEENARLTRIRQIVSTCDTYGIRACVVPAFNDFISAKVGNDLVGGMHLLDLSLMDTCNIMGVNIVVTDMDKTVECIETKLDEWRGKYICVANVHTTVTAHEDEDYLKIQNGAVMALPDGGPLSQYSREHGYAAARRVTGPDLMKQILSVSAQHGWRHYFYGSTQETLDTMREKLAERYPGAVIAGMYSPPFRELTPQEDAAVVEQINAARPDFVWVGLGAPKQERWMCAHEDRVQALMVGVGAAFDYEAGNIRRAPQWMQNRNLEWIYRLLQDPKRLFKRYLNTNVKYLFWAFRHGGEE